MTAPALLEAEITGLLPGAIPVNGLLPLHFDPRGADGRRLTTPVRSQGLRDTRCTAYAIANAMETWLCRTRGSCAHVPFMSVDDLFTGNEHLDPAAERAGLGVSGGSYPPGSSPLPDDPARWKLRFRTFSFTPVEQRPPKMCEALVRDGPLAVSLRIHDNWDAFSDPEGTRVYRPEAHSLPHSEAHAVCVIGFDQIERVWIVKNSDDRWGHGGFGLIGWGDRALGPPEANVIATKKVVPA